MDGWIYLLQERVHLNTNTYKLGRTGNISDRLKSRDYRFCKIISICYCPGVVDIDNHNPSYKEAEDIIKKEFKSEFGNPVEGSETFCGDVNKMIEIVETECKKRRELWNKYKDFFYKFFNPMVQLRSPPPGNMRVDLIESGDNNISDSTTKTWFDSVLEKSPGGRICLKTLRTRFCEDKGSSRATAQWFNGMCKEYYGDDAIMINCLGYEFNHYNPSDPHYYNGDNGAKVKGLMLDGYIVKETVFRPKITERNLEDPWDIIHPDERDAAFIKNISINWTQYGFDRVNNKINKQLETYLQKHHGFTCDAHCSDFMEIVDKMQFRARNFPVQLAKYHVSNLGKLPDWVGRERL